MELFQSANQVSISQSRLPEIDMLRGFALLGIAVENIFAIHTPNVAFADYAALYPGGLNHWLIWGLMVLVRGKFYPIFSLVFGLAAAYSLPKYGTIYFVRRLAGLFLLGLLQVLFIWQGDVLMQYALMGALLLLCRSMPAWSLIACSAALLLFSFVGESWWPLGAGQSEAEAVVYTSGSFWDVIQVRVREYGQSLSSWQALLFYARIFAFMLLGYVVVKAELLQKLTVTYQTIKAFSVHLAVAVAIALWFVVAGWRQVGNSSEAGSSRAVLLAVYFYSFVACYSLLPILFKRLLKFLKWLGQLTLTHYITQNILFSLLMYGYGFGLYGKLAPWQLLVLYLIVITGQWAVSQWWVRRYRLGPAEALLRAIAGKK
ncbi:DUF418 domain-containing protein [Rufibacter roseus]|uniref:DUF418 domain-containing protein n=1 Tax=Rufibacter roseus TaxID=1567108 RepID=A0ABW2DL83_9BACT|nr:DUF418 domain-containing protein [Rufibacter roseus]